MYVKHCNVLQDGRPGSIVEVHDDVLRRTTRRLADDQLPSVDGPASAAAQKADVVPTPRRQVVV